MGKYFGTDGFRGEANVNLTVEHAFRIGRFLGGYFGKGAKIVIGKDTRRSSYMFEYAIASGITASGSDAYLMHVTTTPSVAYMVRTEHFDCGVMISASHNPYYDNGIKLIGKEGTKISADVEEKIEAYIDTGKEEIPLARREEIGRTVDYYAGRNRYIGHLISIPTRSYKGLRIGLDCANGSTSSIAKSVFEALGADVSVICNVPDGLNINEHCGSTHLERLQQHVKEQKLDLGFAFDGDGDRVLAVDGNGNAVDGDLILYICGKYLKEAGALPHNTIVTTVMSNLGLYKALQREGINYVQTAVGDKYVAESMFRNGYAIGGEQSGHIIFGKYATTGDGILTALLMMEAVLERKTTLAALASEVTIFPQILINVRVKDKKEARENAAVRRAVEEAERELGSEGRILVRESGTEPLIRIMVEASLHTVCEAIAQRVANVIHKEQLSV